VRDDRKQETCEETYERIKDLIARSIKRTKGLTEEEIRNVLMKGISKNLGSRNRSGNYYRDS